MKVKFTLSIGYASGKHEDIVDLPDDLTDDDIQEEYMDWRNNYLDGGWSRVEDEE